MSSYLDEDDQKPLALVSPMNWAVLSFFCALIIIAFVYSCFTYLPIRVNGQGLIFNPSQTILVSAPNSGTVKSVFTYWGEKVEIGTPLVELMPSQDILKSETKGEAFALEVIGGEPVESGQPLLWIQKPLLPNQGLQVSGIVPSLAAEQVHVGMNVEVYLAGANPAEYGRLKGKVAALIPFWEKEGVRRFPIDNIIDTSRETDLLKLVVIDLIKDQRTASGYAWTSDKGPPFPIQIGTPCHFKISIEKKNLISYLFSSKNVE
ncbi:MAG: HlyD family efflux transporter periplasmic adaptor subunit [Simkania sp.]|nr:HlyD family efflux transporter periplasmic adaptor subunit [Simkania sp.]MCP5490220.1 HlyD family efflux transporter periplasmic adaptor subunit [Chlamydiales bacterium]